MNLGFLSSPNRWAYFMISILSILVAGYIIWHIIDRPGSKNVMLTSAEQTDIQNILDGLKPEGNSNQRSATGSDTLNDKSKAISADEYANRREQVYSYITQTHTMLDTSDKATLRATLKLMPDERSLRSYLNTHPVRVYSPYHLNGRSMLWELICWALFGVICNLFYNVSESYKGTDVKKKTPDERVSDLGTEPDNVELVASDENSAGNSQRAIPDRLRRRLLGGFDPAEVPSHIAKLIYTPFLVVIIYLALVSFNSTTDLEWVQYGEGVIVFAFVIGFFSGRMVDLLERIKDLFLPIGRFGSESLNRNPHTSVDKLLEESEQEPKSELKVVPDLAAAGASNGLSMFVAGFAPDNLPPAPISGFAKLKIKYRLELDKPTRKLKFFNLGDFSFLSVVLQQMDSTKLIYSNEKLDSTLDVLSNDVEGTPDFFKIFVQFRIDRGVFEPDPALDCFLFLFYIDADSGKPISFPVHQANSRNATLTFRMGSSGIIHVHEDVLWTSPKPAPPNDVSTPAAELPVV